MDKVNSCVGLGLLACLVLPPVARAEVAVRFTESSRFVDAGDYGSEIERNLRVLARYFDLFGKRCLPAGQRLEIEVLDVDLAGRKNWTARSADDARVLTAGTWPRIDLKYALRDAVGALISEGSDRLEDRDYLRHSRRVRNGRALLPYENELIGEWFVRRICDDRRR